jgi:hypothetical protein
MAQLGHTDPAFTLRVYAHAMRFSEEERARLKALGEGVEWAPTGTKAAEPVAGQRVAQAVPSHDRALQRGS